MTRQFYYIQNSQEAPPRVRYNNIIKLASTTRKHLKSLREIDQI